MATVIRLPVLLLACGFACLVGPVRAADVLVTEVRGAVVATKGAKPVRALDVMRDGQRLTVPAGAKASLFVAEKALLYTLEGPVVVLNGPPGLTALSGKLPEPIKLNDAYRKLRVNDPAHVQATLVMRSGDAGVRVLSPEGVVAPTESRRFSWKKPAGKVRFELATDDGQLLHSAETEDSQLALPENIVLAPAVKYVWGLADVRGGAPVDWTEFAIDVQAPPLPPAGSPERVIHVAWLRSRELPRAAARTAEGVTR